MSVTTSVTIRQARIRDVDEIVAIVNHYAAQGIMLPRSRLSVLEGIQRFVVAVDGEEVVGVGALHVLWDDLGEIRSLAIAEEAKGKGIGKKLVNQLLEEGRRLGLKRALSLTYQTHFFASCGFRVVPKESLPQKVWKDCIHCSKLPFCDEIAMICDLD